MSRKPLNTIAIEQYLDSVRVATKMQQKEIRLSNDQYRSLADSISMVLARLVELQDAQPKEEEAINVQMDGGSFWSKINIYVVNLKELRIWVDLNQ